MQYPMLRLELEHMKQTMVTALMDYNGEIERAINEQLSEVVKNYDFAAVIAPIAGDVLNHAITEWDDEQVEDFWVNYLLEPPQSDEFQEVSAQERRARLKWIYNYLFTAS